MELFCPAHDCACLIDIGDPFEALSGQFVCTCGCVSDVEHDFDDGDNPQFWLVIVSVPVASTS